MSIPIPGTARKGLRRQLYPAMRPIVDMAEERGWWLELGRSGHFRLRHPDDRMIVFSPSPSDVRTHLKARAELRRALRKLPA
jgi:hypothetical protein